MNKNPTNIHYLNSNNGATHPIGPERLIRRATLHTRDRERLNRIFNTWPNAKDITTRLGRYLVNIPCITGRGSLFKLCIKTGQGSIAGINSEIHEHEKLVVQLYIRYVGGLLTHVDEVLYVDTRITTSTGEFRWDPFKEPLCEFWSRYGIKPKYRVRKDPIHCVTPEAFRTTIANRILRGNDLELLGGDITKIV